jgi:FkbM family methyltransferase
MIIRYGLINNSINVTNICITKLSKNNIITIPQGDVNRAKYFTDPLIGVKKKIIIENEGNTTEHDDFTEIKINLLNKSIQASDINDKIKYIQSKLKIKFGTFNEELPEQKMIARYLTGNENVLEIGGNIGRSSLIISSILRNKSKNLVTLESSLHISKQLEINRDLNNFKFHIENAALSNRKLIQKNWITKPSDVLEEGYTWVNTITLKNLKNKYNINFDTIVLDCEGAFYYILMDMPEILNGINLIIMENDYNEISHKNYIDDVLNKNKFNKIYSESGGWGPCYNNFFEVWKK